MKSIACFCLAALLLFNTLGCVAIVVGGAAGALGAYAVSKDTIQGDSDKPYDALWATALDEARMRGKIRKEDYAKGEIRVDIEKSIVWIKFNRLTRATTRVKISSRKYHLPDLGLAEDLYVRIIEQAR